MGIVNVKLDRNALLKEATASNDTWDFIVVGGGATGLGCAVDAASRGLRTVLLEQSDFAKGTSSRSTKLAHGGVRYLEQGNVALVRDALRERGLMLNNAPHLVKRQAFIIPHYAWWERPFYGIGLRLYDALAGRLGLGRSRHLSFDETRRHLPTVNPAGLRGGLRYYDGQFDDARLAINLAQTLGDLGGLPLNYAQVRSFLKANGRVCGVVVRDVESGESYELKARVVVNATGVFSDALRRLDEPQVAALVAPSQGAHIVLDRGFLPSNSALMVPRTDDGRVLFAIPWHGRVVLGTTDTPVESVALEPRPLEHEIDFLLSHAARYLTQAPQADDVLSAFAGLRPLVNKGASKHNTASLSRDHTLLVSASGLVTITGGKWTTYRKMGQDTVDAALKLIGVDGRPSSTKGLHVHGWQETNAATPESVYGSDAAALCALVAEHPEWNERLHPDVPCRAVEVVWAARRELARTVEDVLARRTRSLLLDARASVAAAPKVAKLLAVELHKDERWEREQVEAYRKLAQGYVLA